MIDREKLDKLAGHIMILRLPQGTVKQELVEEAYKDAKALASELFPPQARPLTWHWFTDGYWRAGDYIIDDHGVFFRGVLLGSSSDIDAAKSVCERHHQQSFARSLQ